MRRLVLAAIVPSLVALATVTAACTPLTVELKDPSTQPAPPPPSTQPETVDDVTIPQHILDPLVAERYRSSLKDEPPSSGAAYGCDGADPTESDNDAAAYFALMRRSVVIPRGTRIFSITSGYASGGDLGIGKEADQLVHALSDHELCPQDMEKAYIDTASSGALATLPEGVTAGSYWTAESPTSTVVIVHLSMDNRLVVMLRLEDQRAHAIAAEDLDDDVADVVARLSFFERAIELCEIEDEPLPATLCRGFPDW